MGEELVLRQRVRRTPRHVRHSPTGGSFGKLSIIIPCYNEAATICTILDKVLDTLLPAGIAKEVIVVNDCSTDDTDLMMTEYLEENEGAGICYVCHPENRGKGAAIQTGLQHVTGDYLLIQDADLEYDPAEYWLLVEPIISGHADVVYGSRFGGGHPHRILFFWHTLGNRLLTFVSNVFTNMNLSDAHTCYKILPVSIFRKMPLTEKRFAFDAELNVLISKVKGIRIYEVGISYYGRTFAEGKKIRLQDAVRAVWCLLKYSIASKKAGYRLPADSTINSI